MSSRHLMLPVAALAALTLILSGCGSDDDSSSTTTSEKADSSDDRTTTTSDDVTTSGLSPECVELQEAFASVDVQAMMSSFTDGSDPGPQFEGFADALDAAKESAPEEIADDLGAMADGYRQLAASAGDIDWDAIRAGDAQASAAAGELMQNFSSDDLTDAGQQVSDWLNEHCIAQ